MSEAREEMLGRLLATADASGPASPGQAAADGRTATHGGKANDDSNLDEFLKALEAVHGEVHRVGTDWPEVIAEMLAAAGVDQLWYGANGPHGAQLQAGWPSPSAGSELAGRVPRLKPFDESIEHCREALFADRSAGFTSAQAAIAETGTLILWPGPAEPRTLSLVPEVHCVLLEHSRIVPSLEDWMADFCQQPSRTPLPTNLLMITGPSKSADIEQTLTFGVHGPKRLMVFIRT
jgi:L-lactate dehydrogenase complex protein LldG